MRCRSPSERSYRTCFGTPGTELYRNITLGVQKLHYERFFRIRDSCHRGRTTAQGPVPSSLIAFSMRHRARLRRLRLSIETTWRCRLLYDSSSKFRAAAGTRRRRWRSRPAPSLRAGRCRARCRRSRCRRPRHPHPPILRADADHVLATHHGHAAAVGVTVDRDADGRTFARDPRLSTTSREARVLRWRSCRSVGAWRETPSAVLFESNRRSEQATAAGPRSSRRDR